jgi:hypothetical protein
MGAIVLVGLAAGVALAAPVSVSPLVGQSDEQPK